MQAHPSPLKCCGYFVTELVLTANPDYDANKPSALDFKDLQVTSTADVLPQEKEHQKPLWRLLLRVHQNIGPEKNAPYNFVLVLLGHFEVHSDYPADKAKQLAEVNGSSILYSAARQILRDAMNNGPFRPLILPTVSFADMAVPPSANKVAEPTAAYGEEKK